jgi:hypothetical protein
MISASDVKQKLALLAQGKLSLNAFEGWLEPYVWDMDQDSHPDALDLVYSIQLLFSERNNRRLDAAALRRQLLALINDAVISVQFDDNLQPVSGAVSPLSPARLFASPHPEPVRVFHLQPI